MTPYTVDRTKWEKMTIFEQLGNIYSEVGRSFEAKKRGAMALAMPAMYRAIDLFDATVEVLVRNKSPKTKEVLRAKEVYLNTIFDSGEAAEKMASLDRYFYQFAVAARRQR